LLKLSDFFSKLFLAGMKSGNYPTLPTRTGRKSEMPFPTPIYPIPTPTNNIKSHKYKNNKKPKKINSFDRKRGGGRRWVGADPQVRSTCRLMDVRMCIDRWHWGAGKPVNAIEWCIGGWVYRTTQWRRPSFFMLDWLFNLHKEG